MAGRPEGTVNVPVFGSPVKPGPVPEPKAEITPRLGRPPGLKAKMAELRELMVADSVNIVQKLLKKAQNDDDKDQLAAIKLCLEALQKGVDEEEGTNKEGFHVTITDAGPNATVQISQGGGGRLGRPPKPPEVIDVEVKDVTDGKP